ncbi:3-hydroxybutyryl-CoA dehydrogenase [Arenicella chitinivorans]|uniref:3-hydroxybutyryl-CoA dehydrogenase n=1 Tax=Arenicella chitinivorans TaxID=1329800 RepID=A0A918RG03_9GAMM|nr:3-hydroxyacyl-CoA dehydrogenase NAD-binding domain-containing protein [Arenicella chitinivorans]GGZ98624.1 3-hydroxybutyryl-CoA dehydrogenase [Arenicella chitinivorans]
MKQIDDIRQIMVAGGGTLGLRIALRCALDGYHVTLFDLQESQLETAKQQHARLVHGLLRDEQVSNAQAGRVATHLQMTTDLSEAVKETDLVIESITEDVPIKNAFFTDVCPLLSPDVLLATNTSFLLPSQFLSAVDRPAQFCAFHFHDVFNQTVVDVMPHSETDPDYVALLMEFGRRIHQIPVHVQQETPGYLFNAMLFTIMQQATQLLTSGAGSIQDIDRSFMGNFKTPAGPFGMLDQIGLDTALHIAHNRPELTGDHFVTLLQSYVDKGHLGFKSGQGFYRYPKPEFAQPGFLAAHSGD